MDAGSQWVIKLGPLERQNGAATREQSEAGARRMVLDAGKALMAKAKEMAPEFLLNVNGPTGAGTPELVEEAAEVDLHSYELPNGSWFTLGCSNCFGFKVTCRKA
jgi:hypothetical protein